MITDLIANNLTVIRNGIRAKKEQVDVPASKMFSQILAKFKENGFIKNYKFIEDKKQGLLRVYLKYSAKGKPAINYIKRVSKPGLRKYVKEGEIPLVLNGMGVAIISTSKGILTDKNCRREKIGGEVVCYIW